MRKYLFLAAAAAAAIASPAAARDGSIYAGIEGGFWGPSDTTLDIDALYPTTTNPAIPSGLTHYDSGADVHYRRGIDTDILAGYYDRLDVRSRLADAVLRTMRRG